MSLEDLKKAILQAKASTVERKKPTIKKPKSTVESKVLVQKIKTEIKPKTPKEERLTSDQLRAVYFLLFGKVSRKSNIEVAKEIVTYLKNKFNF